MKFNTVTIDEITSEFGEFENFRAVLNTGDHEYHITDLFESASMAAVVEFISKNWSDSQVVIGRTI